MRRYAKVRPGMPKNLAIRASSDTYLKLVLGGAQELELRECRKLPFSVMKSAPFRKIHKFKI